MPPDGLNPKQTIDAYLAVSKMHRDRMDQRRSYEWKVSLALWSGLGFIGGQLLVGGRAGTSWSWFLLIPIVIIFVFYVLWIWVIGKSNWDDRETAKFYMELAEEALPKALPCKPSTMCKWYSQVFQTAITFALLMVLVIASCREPGAPERVDVTVLNKELPLSVSLTTQPSPRPPKAGQ